MRPFRKFIIVTGHYGSGKTTVAVNLAARLQKAGGSVTLVDLDIVNPFFRSFDFAEKLSGVELIAPNFAGTTLDVPSLSPKIDGVFASGRDHVIFDTGGDFAGATALGCYSARVPRDDYEMLYTVNSSRALTGTPAEAAALLEEIEHAAKLPATGIVNNTHLSKETTAKTVAASVPYARAVSALTRLPLRFTAVRRDLAAASGVPEPFALELFSEIY